MRWLAILLVLVSCSQAKRAQWHYKKALKNGLEVVVDSDTIRITSIDSVPVIINNEVVWEKYITTKDTVVQFKNIYVPKTRYQERIEYRYKTRVERIRGKTIYKTAKATQVIKYRCRWWPIIVAFVLGFVLNWLLKTTTVSKLWLAWKYRNQL